MTPPSTMSSRSSCRITDGIQSPWIQPLGRADLEEDLPRADLFPFPCAAAFFTRSRAEVLPFVIVAGEVSHGPAALGRERRWRKDLRRERGGRKEEKRAHCLETPSRRFIRGRSRVADW